MIAVFNMVHSTIDGVWVSRKRKENERKTDEEKERKRLRVIPDYTEPSMETFPSIRWEIKSFESFTCCARFENETIASKVYAQEDLWVIRAANSARIIR
jgi:hypothetical protein